MKNLPSHSHVPLGLLGGSPRLAAARRAALQSLRPGGAVVVEGYHTDAALDRPPGPGPGVTYEDNELLRLFPTLRVVRYEDVKGRADWGMCETRLVRLLAQRRSGQN